MSYMFCHCESLKELDLSNFNTDNVADMRGMFSICKSLEKINLSHFNTNKVTDMTYMFCECSSLKEIDVSNFYIDDDIGVESMFFGLSDEIKKIIKNQIKNINEKVFIEDNLF